MDGQIRTCQFIYLIFPLSILFFYHFSLTLSRWGQLSEQYVSTREEYIDQKEEENDKLFGIKNNLFVIKVYLNMYSDFYSNCLHYIKRNV